MVAELSLRRANPPRIKAPSRAPVDLNKTPTRHRVKEVSPTTETTGPLVTDRKRIQGSTSLMEEDLDPVEDESKVATLPEMTSRRLCWGLDSQATFCQNTNIEKCYCYYYCYSVVVAIKVLLLLHNKYSEFKTVFNNFSKTYIFKIRRFKFLIPAV